MADPNHIPLMDSLDVWSVRLYRTGLSAIALGLALAAWRAFATMAGVPLGWLLVAIGAALATANLHLYAKSFRWVFQMATGVALSMLLVASAALPSKGALFLGGLALLCVPVCGFALKEYFCFQLTGMRLLPVLLGIGVLSELVAPAWLPGLALACAALIYGYLAMAKWRMPLHYDIGDKSKYEV